MVKFGCGDGSTWRMAENYEYSLRFETVTLRKRIVQRLLEALQLPVGILILNGTGMN